MLDEADDEEEVYQSITQIESKNAALQAPLQVVNEVKENSDSDSDSDSSSEQESSI